MLPARRNNATALAFILSTMGLFLPTTIAFWVPLHPLSGRAGSSMAAKVCSVRMMASVRIEKDEKSVGLALCSILKEEYGKAVSVKSGFSFCISGGSMLKMLSNLDGSSDIDWSKCSMGFVSHRCLPLDDDGATYHKARPLFLQSWMDKGLTVITPTGSTDSDKEAETYEVAMRSLPSDVLSHNSAGLPEWDLLLIGVGTDGHVGSIYPNIPDVESTLAVVPITGVDAMGKVSTKISFSLATMKASKASVVACAGKSAKAPLGKAQAMVRGLESADETPMSFPASALRDKATWLLDQDSAALLQRK